MERCTIFALAALLFWMRYTSGSSAYSGDIAIESNDKNGQFNCDGLICPEKTFVCEVTKNNDPKDLKQLIWERTCRSEDGKTLKRQVVRELNKSGGTVNSHAFAFADSGGYGVSSEEARQMAGRGTGGYGYSYATSY